jgi:hypothetical protein
VLLTALYAQIQYATNSYAAYGNAASGYAYPTAAQPNNAFSITLRTPAFPVQSNCANMNFYLLWSLQPTATANSASVTLVVSGFRVRKAAVV